MKKIRIALTVSAILLGVGAAFAGKHKASVNTTLYGITSVSGGYYNVTPFDATNFKCAVSSNECSFNYPTAGETQIAVDDPNITNLQSGTYQHK